MKNVSLQFYFSYNDHTLPACLPDPAHTYTVGNTCYLSGWGSTARKSLEPHRHKTAYRSAKAQIVLASAQAEQHLRCTLIDKPGNLPLLRPRMVWIFAGRTCHNVCCRFVVVLCCLILVSVSLTFHLVYVQIIF